MFYFYWALARRSVMGRIVCYGQTHARIQSGGGGGGGRDPDPSGKAQNYRVT